MVLDEEHEMGKENGRTHVAWNKRENEGENTLLIEELVDDETKNFH